jgi:hypothetical protein
MPKGPKGQKRPANVTGKVTRVVKMAEDFPADDGKDKAAQSLGQRGGRARAKSLTEEQRTAIARKAARARWS